MSEQDSAVLTAVESIARGDIVIVTDDAGRENEGDLIMASEFATPDKIAFFLAHTSGVICVGIDGQRCDALGLPSMVACNTDPKATAFTVSVDARCGTTTGISVDDRARTLRKLVDPAARPTDFTQPGHIFPLRARPGGVLTRAGHTEASVDLSRLAGGAGGGVLCEVVTPNKLGMARHPELKQLSKAFGLPMVTIADLIRYRVRHQPLIVQEESARIPTDHGCFEARVCTSLLGGTEHLALIRGNIAGDEPVLVRVHSECLTGDVLYSRRCDCGSQLDESLDLIARAGRGVLIYLRGQEGRGIGLRNKIAAYRLQDQGLDTVDANIRLDLPVDSRDYVAAAQILNHLEVGAVRMLTNNPSKIESLRKLGIDVVERVPVPPIVTPQNRRYLQTKRDRMGHVLPAMGLGGRDLPA